MSVCHRSRAQSNLCEHQPLFLLLEVISKMWKLIFKRKQSRELYLQRHNLVEYTVSVHVTYRLDLTWKVLVKGGLALIVIGMKIFIG